MGQRIGFQEILRRLAVIDESAVEQHAGLGLGLPGAAVLDARTAELVRVAAVAAIGAPEVCLEWSVTRALAAGATEDEITGVLLAIAPGSRARPRRLRRSRPGNRTRVRRRNRADRSR